MVKWVLAILIFVVGVGLGIVLYKTPPSELVIYTYSSFAASWGPGPALIEKFQKESGISVELVDVGDAGLLIQRLMLEDRQARADLVLGIDQLMLNLAQEKLKWREVKNRRGLHLKQSIQHSYFIPFDWAPLTFIYRKGEVEPPSSLDDLLDNRFKGKITLSDPRTSTPGFQFLLWVLSEKGEVEGFRFLRQLKDHLHSVSPSWSTSYGLFKKGEALLSFSYFTSPIYHWIEEKDMRYQFALMKGNHLYQIEYMAIPEKSKNADAADKFIRFMLKPEVQKIVMRYNFMLPVVQVELDDFSKIPEVNLVDEQKIESHLTKRNDLLKKWNDIWQ